MVFADPPPPPPVPLPKATTVEGRVLRAVRQGDPVASRRVLVIGQVHGDEPEGPRVVVRLRQRSVPAGTQLVTVMSANPDGARRARRQNARGVDLNRNFPGSWRPTQRGTRFYGGPGPGSERETRWLMRLVRAVRPQVTVWLHQPYGLTHLTPGADPVVVRRYARRTGLPARTLPRSFGTATAWQNRTFPTDDAFVVELTGGRQASTTIDRHVRAVLATLGD